MSFQIKVGLDEAVRISEGMWRASVEPARLAGLGHFSTAERGPSIIFLDEEPRGANGSGVEFALHRARLVNLGTLSEVIVIWTRDLERVTGEGIAAPVGGPAPTGLAQGDMDFLNSLPRHLRDLGEKFLRAMRREFPGQLEYREGSGRWIETPDPWWTIKGQPYKQNFYISVRRPPEDYDAPTSIVMRRERASWSRLYFGAEEHLADVMAVIRQASRYKK